MLIISAYLINPLSPLQTALISTTASTVGPMITVLFASITGITLMVSVLQTLHSSAMWITVNPALIQKLATHVWIIMLQIP